MISLVRPIIGPEEQAAVAAVLASGQLAQGPRVAEFEERFAAYCGADGARFKNPMRADLLRKPAGGSRGR